MEASRSLDGSVKVDSKSVRVLDCQASKGITLPKKWIPDIGMTNLNMHLIKEDASGRSYALIEIPSH